MPAKDDNGKETNTDSQKETKKRRRKPQDYSKLTRNSQVKIRLTEAERSALKTAASCAGLSLADYVLKTCAWHKPIIQIPGAAQLRTELLREGRNLNHALHMANIDRRNGRALDWKAIQNAVEKVEKNLDMLSEVIRKWDVDIAERVDEST